jgi:hypothetical protein
MIQMFPADFPKFSERSQIGAAARRWARKLRVKEVKLIDDEAWARQFKEAQEKEFCLLSANDFEMV